MKNLFRMGTLGSRIYTFFIIFIFITIFILQVVAFRFTINTVRSTMIESNRTLLEQLNRQIDSYIEGLEALFLAVIDEPQVKEYLEQGYHDPDSATISPIVEQLRRYLNTRDDILNIYFITNSGQILSADGNATINPYMEVTGQSWYVDAIQDPSQTVITGSYVQNLILGQYSWVTSLSRAVLSSDSGQLLGVLLIDLKFDGIKELCQSMVTGRKGYNFILDAQGNYVFHPAQQLVYSGVKDEPVSQLLAVQEQGIDTYSDTERYYFIATSSRTGWKTVSVLYSDEIITDWKYVQISYAAIGLVLFLILGLAINRITRGITSPVKKLQEIMRSAETGDFHLVGQIDATDEIKELAHDYDVMVGRIRELMRQNVNEQEQKRKSDLKALQAQINPHFLYNTLDSIIWMAEMQQHAQVVQMTSALSKLMRISISKGREFITVADEIAHVQSYLTIEQMRYRDKYETVLDIDPDILEETILKITLQPLVENAIYHGIKEADHKGTIRITGRRVDKLIEFTVSDDGVGMSEQKLREISSLSVEDEDRLSLKSSHGMGVRNVHARIKLYFGPEYGLRIESRIGEGTTVTVLIPSSEAGL